MFPYTTALIKLSFACSCFINEFSIFVATVLVPVGLVILLDTLIYVVTLSTLHKYSKSSTSLQQVSTHSFRVSLKLSFVNIGLMVIFTITALFIILAFTEGKFIFQAFFSLGCIILGIYAFTFFVLLSKEAREEWKKVFRFCRKRPSGKYDPRMYEMRMKQMERIGDSNVSKADKNVYEEVHVNPGATEEETSEYVIPETATPGRDESTMHSSGPQNVYIEVIGEVESNNLSAEAEEVAKEDEKSMETVADRLTILERHPSNHSKHSERLNINFGNHFSDDDSD